MLKVNWYIFKEFSASSWLEFQSAVTEHNGAKVFLRSHYQFHFIRLQFHEVTSTNSIGVWQIQLKIYLAPLCQIFALEKPLASSRYTTRRIRYFCSEWGILIFDSHAHKWSKCWDTDTFTFREAQKSFYLPWRSKGTKDFVSLHYRLLVLSQNGMKYLMNYHSYFPSSNRYTKTL